MKPIVKNAFLWGLIFSCTVLYFFFGLFAFGPRIESAFYPVFKNVSAVPISVDSVHGIIRIGATADKVRMCEWTGIQALVFREGMWLQGKIYFSDPRLPGPEENLPISRPTGRQSLGQIYVRPDGDKIKVVVYHRCHPLWQTTTLLYELDLNNWPNQVR